MRSVLWWYYEFMNYRSDWACKSVPKVRLYTRFLHVVTSFGPISNDLFMAENVRESIRVTTWRSCWHHIPKKQLDFPEDPGEFPYSSPPFWGRQKLLEIPWFLLLFFLMNIWLHLDFSLSQGLNIGTSSWWKDEKIVRRFGFPWKKWFNNSKETIYPPWN